MAEARDFNNTQLGFAQAHCKIPPRRKSGLGPGLWKIPIIWGYPFNISATAETSDFKFGEQLEFAKAHHKITPKKVGLADD